MPIIWSANIGFYCESGDNDTPKSDIYVYFGSELADLPHIILFLRECLNLNRF